MTKKLKSLMMLSMVVAMLLAQLNFVEAGHLEDISARGTIRVGTTGDYIPMSYLNPQTGEYEGIDAELSRIIADSLGVKLEYVPTTWPTLSDYLSKPVMPYALDAMLLKHLTADKLVFDSADTEEAEETQLPDWLSDIPLISPRRGIEFCGGPQEYLDTLKLFAASIKERADDRRAAETSLGRTNPAGRQRGDSKGLCPPTAAQSATGG